MNLARIGANSSLSRNAASAWSYLGQSPSLKMSTKPACHRNSKVSLVPKPRPPTITSAPPATRFRCASSSVMQLLSSSATTSRLPRNGSVPASCESRSRSKLPLHTNLVPLDDSV